jgi:hypothetical protein
MPRILGSPLPAVPAAFAVGTELKLLRTVDPGARQTNY